MVQQREAWVFAAPPSPLLAVPNVTAHQYTTLFHHKYDMVVEKQAISKTRKIHLTIIAYSDKAPMPNN